MKKKICFFSGDITRMGGTERVALQVANALADQGMYDISIISITEQNITPFFEIDSRIPRFSLWHTWVNPGIGYVKILRKLRKLFKKQCFDVVIDIDLVLDVLTISSTWRLPTKVVSWEHFTAEYEKSIRYRRWIVRYAAQCSNHIVVLTEQDRMAYQTLFGRKKNITVIRNPKMKSNLQMFHVKHREKHLITIARLVPEKGIARLARIIPVILKKNPDWKWVVLGDGKERRVLEQIVKEHHLQGRLLLKGAVKDVYPYLQQSRIFVLTSHYEGLGICLLEAMEMGVPCVSFDVKMGPREIIRSGQNGILVSDGKENEMIKKIDDLIQRTDVLESMAQETQAGMENFEMEYILEQWNHLLEKLTEDIKHG